MRKEILETRGNICMALLIIGVLAYFWLGIYGVLQIITKLYPISLGWKTTTLLWLGPCYWLYNRVKN